MGIDIRAETIINRPRDQVATYAMNSDNDPSWISGISQSRMLTDPPMGTGTRLARVAHFLGRRIEYVNEVTEYDQQGLLVMRSVSGPFPMTIRYQFEEATTGTLAEIQVQGEASGFFKVATPLLAAMVKRNVKKDLDSLKAHLESGSART